MDRATVLTPMPLPVIVCRDRDDDEVLAEAIAANAEAIVTGDKDLLTLKSYEGIPILSPRQFAELLDKGSCAPA